eukprot:3296271-Pleurochrysis_carterae.AAC.3
MRWRRRCMRVRSKKREDSGEAKIDRGDAENALTSFFCDYKHNARPRSIMLWAQMAVISV